MMYSIKILPLLASVALCDNFLSTDSDLLQFMGRWVSTYDGNGNAVAYADWSSSSVGFSFHGTETSLSFGDSLSSTCKGYYLDVYVDCRLASTLNVTVDSEQVLSLASGLEEADHSVRVIKRTEVSDPGLCGAWSLSGLSSDGVFLQFNETCRKQLDHSILFIGDSKTVGYGIDDLDPCSFQASTENVDHTYAAHTALHFGAAYHTIAWSGKGIVRNYGDVNQESDPEWTMPYLFNRTLGTYSEFAFPIQDVENTWDMQKFVPDVVSINLGANDYSTKPYPTSESFIERYVTFATWLARDVYPGSFLFLSCGPVPSPPDAPLCSNVQQVKDVCNTELGSEVVFYVDMIGLLTDASDVGCAGHPSAKGNVKMAKVLEDEIERVMKWTPID